VFVFIFILILQHNIVITGKCKNMLMWLLAVDYIRRNLFRSLLVSYWESD